MRYYSDDEGGHTTVEECDDDGEHEKVKGEIAVTLMLEFPFENGEVEEGHET